LSKRFDEEIPKRKTICLSHAKAGRVFVFPEFRSLTRQISAGLDFLVLFYQVADPPIFKAGKKDINTQHFFNQAKKTQIKTTQPVNPTIHQKLL